MQITEQFLSAAFCPPTGAWEHYPDRLTDDVFTVLKQAGINRIFAFGMDDRSATRERTFAQCEKYQILYYPCVASASEYVRILPGENGEKPWAERTEQEKRELDAGFVQEVSQLLHYPAFGGIFFCDECGYLSFEGIAHAKRVFDAHFPGYEFHTNFFSYSINDGIFWGGMAFHEHPDGLQRVKTPFELTGELEIKFKNRFKFYDKLTEGLISKAHFEYISQDKYPFEEFWPTLPTSVHKALFELNAFLKQKSLKYGSRFYNYMQVGTWGNGTRQMTSAEMALQMNVTVAYGAAGFGHFPAVYPLDWRHWPAAHGGAGFVDMDAKPTRYAQYAKDVHCFLNCFAADILNATFVGITAYGTYDNGFDKEAVKALPDSECIYVGELPDILRYEDERIKASCTNQISLSTFLKDGKRRYFAVNLSTVYDNEVNLYLPDGKYRVYTPNGSMCCAEKVEQRLLPGCAMYIAEE